MKPDIAILQELIQDKALVTVKKDQYGNNFLKLKELGKGRSSRYEIKVLNPPEDTIAIKSDMFPPPKEIFRNIKGECKRCDFVVIAKDERKNWIVYLEMKGGRHASEKEIIQQLRGARCFIDYCRVIGQTFWEESEFLEEKDYQELYVCIKNIGVAKRPSRETKAPSLHDFPENMLKINAPPPRGIWFKELIGVAN